MEMEGSQDTGIQMTFARLLIFDRKCSHLHEPVTTCKDGDNILFCFAFFLSFFPFVGFKTRSPSGVLELTMYPKVALHSWWFFWPPPLRCRYYKGSFLSLTENKSGFQVLRDLKKQVVSTLNIDTKATHRIMFMWKRYNYDYFPFHFSVLPEKWLVHDTLETSVNHTKNAAALTWLENCHMKRSVGVCSSAPGSQLPHPATMKSPLKTETRTKNLEENIYLNFSSCELTWLF